MKIFETHAHYDDRKFDSDRAELLSALPKMNVSPVINVGASMESTKESLALADEWPYIYAAIGVHPEEIKSLTEEDMEYLSAHAGDPKVAAIGEIGLDYHYLKEDYKYIEDLDERHAAIDAVKEKQKYWFLRQMEIAREADLPCIFHMRDAAADTMELLTDAAAKGTRGVIHCYSYSVDHALKYIDMGYYIGVGGAVTFSDSKKLAAVVAAVPLERIVTETDCPYMAPEPFRGRRNDSTYIPYVIKRIAEIREITEDEVLETTAENAYRLFPKVKKKY
ncbi:MAG: TatD family hydrolase [Lachnospiraceae bacterium]|nr:TatD family hydrolase [Lachnospiraceae bacterium]